MKHITLTGLKKQICFNVTLIVYKIIGSFDRTEKTDLFQLGEEGSYQLSGFDRTEKTDLFQSQVLDYMPDGSFDRTEKTDLFQ